MLFNIMVTDERYPSSVAARWSMRERKDLAFQPPSPISPQHQSRKPQRENTRPSISPHTLHSTTPILFSVSSLSFASSLAFLHCVRTYLLNCLRDGEIILVMLNLGKDAD